MSIWNRFVGIMKQRRMPDTGPDLSPAEIERLLQDDESDELSREINNLNTSPKVAPTPDSSFKANVQSICAEVGPPPAAAFEVLQIAPTADIAQITAAFKRQIQMCHPDKNPNANSQKLKELQAKSANIINAHNAIKLWLDNEK